MKIYTIIIFIFLAPLTSLAGAEDQFVFIFDKHNEALKRGDVKELEKYLVEIQASVFEECLADRRCGEGAIRGMKNGALSQYSITNFVEYAKGSRILKLQDKNAKIDKVNGPAVQLYYEGIEVRGFAGKGHTTFIVEDGAWKISTTTWGAR